MALHRDNTYSKDRSRCCPDQTQPSGAPCRAETRSNVRALPAEEVQGVRSRLVAVVAWGGRSGFCILIWAVVTGV